MSTSECEVMKHFLRELFLSMTSFTPIKQFPRGSTLFAKEHFGNKPIKVVEVGTYRGHNAVNIIKELNVEKIYLIDAYGGEEIGYTEILAPRLPKAEREANRKLSRFKNKVVWIKKKSDLASIEIEPNSIDFIYIDGDHSKEWVTKDLRNYYPLLRKGGILAGHDFHLASVAVPVVEFSNAIRKEIFTNRLDWWFVK